MTKAMRSARWVFAAAFAGALAFGGRQALAAPAEVEASACKGRECAEHCASLGGRGFCVGDFCKCAWPSE